MKELYYLFLWNGECGVGKGEVPPPHPPSPPQKKIKIKIKKNIEWTLVSMYDKGLSRDQNTAEEWPHPCNRIWLPSQSAIKKKKEEEKSPYTFAHLVNFSKCLSCLIIIQYCYFDNRINKRSHTHPVYLHFALSTYYVRAQRTIGFLS